MIKTEFDEVAKLIVSIRRDVETLTAKCAALEAERDELAAHVSAHVDALKQSNAQCGEYLRQNEQLHAAKDEMQNALAEATKDLAYSRLAVDTMCARDKRFTSTAALCGAGTNEDVGDFIERTAAERGKLHSELVDVRAALAATTEQRDSLRRTLDEWERADTKPHERVDPPIRMGLISETGPAVFVRIGAPPTDDIADHVVLPVLPMCTTCHECGSELANCSQGTNHHDCPRPLCPRTCTGRHGGGFSPYSGPCKSATPVRHE